jgi:hypothetical protein
MREDEKSGKLTPEKVKDLKQKLMIIRTQMTRFMMDKIDKNENNNHFTPEEETHFYELMKVYKKDNELTQCVTYFSDLKGDGSTEKIVLTFRYVMQPWYGKSFMSLYIYDMDRDPWLGQLLLQEENRFSGYFSQRL